MKTPAEENIQRLRDAYSAFNNRDAETVLSLMTTNVVWPRAFKGGFVEGPDAIRAYWMEQWSEINATVDPMTFETEETGQIRVSVHQVVRDLDGNLLADEHLYHRFTMDGNLIAKMELPSNT